MAIVTCRRMCRTCGSYRIFEKQGTGHAFHLLMCIVTVGCWLPIWLLVAILNTMHPYSCRQCGKAKW